MLPSGVTNKRPFTTLVLHFVVHTRERSGEHGKGEERKRESGGRRALGELRAQINV